MDTLYDGLIEQLYYSAICLELASVTRKHKQPDPPIAGDPYV